MDTLKARRLANALASCDCATTGIPAAGTAAGAPIALWASTWEFRNSTDGVHLIMASLALDGVSVDELTALEARRA